MDLKRGAKSTKRGRKGGRKKKEARKVCVYVYVCERKVEGGNIIFKKKIHFSNP